ncbi:hypothetical protein Acsp05_19260 [Actinokineospora sp. NBRC 105648]|nr:hypothetical protein Acsp05_19260 [Actinokineospora sp. NBRC 105648]
MLACTAVLSLTGTAAAAADGTLTPTLSGGTTEDTGITYRTSGPCAVGATTYQLTARGPNGYAEDLNLWSSDPVSITEPFTAHQAAPFAAYGRLLTRGTYTVTLTCTANFGTEVFNSFSTDIYLNSATRWSIWPQPPVPTTVTVSVTPDNPRLAPYHPVTLTATVSPPSAAGRLRFRDGTPLGELWKPVVDGVATTRVSYPLGTRSVVAEFVGTVPEVGDSTSAPLDLLVTDPEPVAVTLERRAAEIVVVGSPFELRATVSPREATGKVYFFFRDTRGLGPVYRADVVGGVATVRDEVPPDLGTYGVVAQFVPPTDRWAVSESAPVPMTIVASSGPATVDITTTVVPGALTISVADQDVVLPPPVLAPDGSLRSTAGSLNPITVTDTRAGNPGWNASGQVTDFAGGADLINGANLGWAPRIVEQSPVQAITAGPRVDPADAIGLTDVAPAGRGLRDSRTMATALALAGNGTARLSADIALKVPTSAPAGTYTARLTLTVI